MNTIDYYGDLGIFLYHTPIVSALVAAFALLANRHRTPPQTWLSAVLIVLGMGMAASFVFDRYLSANRGEILRPVNIICSLAASLTILLYYTSLMRPRLLTRKFIFAFCAGWLLFSLITILPDILWDEFHPLNNITRLTDISSPAVIFRLLINICVITFDVWLGVFIIRMYRQYRTFISETYSFREGISLSWINITIGMFILMGILDMLWLVNSSAGYKMLFNFVSAGAIWTIFWFGFRQGKVVSPHSVQECDENLPDEPLALPEDTKYAKIKVALLDYFQKKKPYLNPELTLKDVAQELGVSHYSLSRSINKEFQMTFYMLINRFRIDNVLHLIDLNRENLNCDTLLAISGFKSRSVFFKQFKEKTGFTPQEYIDRQKKSRSKK